VQAFPDPFAGSGCDCDRFCKNECAINATQPMNITYYRMTMKGVYDLSDKDTGDVAGDTSFVLAKKNNEFFCRHNPTDFICKDVAQFSGDDKNSTDLVLEMTIEVDGQWGPYLGCNPVDVKAPLGDWECKSLSGHTQPKNYPKTCSSDGFEAYEGYC